MNTDPIDFVKHAPLYWAKGLPVIPLRSSQKVPAIANWAVYAAQMPTEDDQQRWLEAFPDANIGLPLGPQSRIVVIDNDSLDPRVEEMLLALMPAVLWKRVGKKGAVYAFKYNGERTYRIKDEGGKTIFEVLSKGAQVVLPPSIHPDTMQPYTANCDLLDVVDQLPCLPPDFETKARQALLDMGFKLTGRGATKITEWVPEGGRDSAMVAHAGLLARAIVRGERTLMEAMNEIETWVMTYTAKVDGDLMDPKKATAKLMEFLRRDTTERGKSLPSNWPAGLAPQDEANARAFFGEIHEDWTVDQFVEHLAQKFAEIPTDRRKDRASLVESVLARLAGSRLTEIEREPVLEYLKAASGLAVGPIRRRLKELMRPPIEGVNHTEIARLVLSDAERQGEIRCVASGLHRWVGSHWADVDEMELLSLIADEFGDLPAAKKANDHKGVFETVRRLKFVPLASQGNRGVNFANGFVTPKLELLPHDPRFGMTYVLPYRFLPAEHAPVMFLEHLESCWGLDGDYLDKVQALREAIAATMFGVATAFQRAICLFGIPHSGKSVISDVVIGLLPKSAISRVPPHDWDDKFLPTQMHNKLLNYCGELSESLLIAGDRFKTIVEGGEINGQHKNAPIFSFSPTCAQWFASNYLPRSRDGSGGFTRRWLILKFNKACPPQDRRIDLAKEILAEEREAIVAWALPAIVGLTKDYTQPASHKAALEDMGNSNNTVRHFLTAGEVEWRQDASWEETHLYNAYANFTTRVGSKSVKLVKFQSMMEELQGPLGFRAEKTNDRGFKSTTYWGIGPVTLHYRRRA